MTRRAGGFFAQPEHCQKLLLDVRLPVPSPAAPRDLGTPAADAAAEVPLRPLTLLGEVAVRRGRCGRWL